MWVDGVGVLFTNICNHIIVIKVAPRKFYSLFCLSLAPCINCCELKSDEGSNEINANPCSHIGCLEDLFCAFVCLHCSLVWEGGICKIPFFDTCSLYGSSLPPPRGNFHHAMVTGPYGILISVWYSCPPLVPSSNLVQVTLPGIGGLCGLCAIKMALQNFNFQKLKLTKIPCCSSASPET